MVGPVSTSVPSSTGKAFGKDRLDFGMVNIPKGKNE